MESSLQEGTHPLQVPQQLPENTHMLGVVIQNAPLSNMMDDATPEFRDGAIPSADPLSLIATPKKNPTDLNPQQLLSATNQTNQSLITLSKSNEQTIIGLSPATQQLADGLPITPERTDHVHPKSTEIQNPLQRPHPPNQIIASNLQQLDSLEQLRIQQQQQQYTEAVIQQRQMMLVAQQHSQGQVPSQDEIDLMKQIQLQQVPHPQMRQEEVAQLGQMGLQAQGSLGSSMQVAPAGTMIQYPYLGQPGMASTPDHHHLLSQQALLQQQQEALRIGQQVPLTSYQQVQRLPAQAQLANPADGLLPQVQITGRRNSASSQVHGVPYLPHYVNSMSMMGANPRANAGHFSEGHSTWSGAGVMQQENAAALKRQEEIAQVHSLLNPPPQSYAQPLALQSQQPPLAQPPLASAPGPQQQQQVLAQELAPVQQQQLPPVQPVLPATTPPLQPPIQPQPEPLETSQSPSPAEQPTTIIQDQPSAQTQTRGPRPPQPATMPSAASSEPIPQMPPAPVAQQSKMISILDSNFSQRTHEDHAQQPGMPSVASVKDAKVIQSQARTAKPSLGAESLKAMNPEVTGASSTGNMTGNAVPQAHPEVNQTAGQIQQRRGLQLGLQETATFSSPSLPTEPNEQGRFDMGNAGLGTSPSPAFLTAEAYDPRGHEMQVVEAATESAEEEKQLALPPLQQEENVEGAGPISARAPAKLMYPHPDIPREDIRRVLTVSKADYLRAMLKTTQEQPLAKQKPSPSAQPSLIPGNKPLRFQEDLSSMMVSDKFQALYLGIRDVLKHIEWNSMMEGFELQPNHIFMLPSFKQFQELQVKEIHEQLKKDEEAIKTAAKAAPRPPLIGHSRRNSQPRQVVENPVVTVESSPEVPRIPIEALTASEASSALVVAPQGQALVKVGDTENEKEPGPLHQNITRQPSQQSKLLRRIKAAQKIKERQEQKEVETQQKKESSTLVKKLKRDKFKRLQVILDSQQKRYQQMVDKNMRLIEELDVIKSVQKPSTAPSEEKEADILVNALRDTSQDVRDFVMQAHLPTAGPLKDMLIEKYRLNVSKVNNLKPAVVKQLVKKSKEIVTAPDTSVLPIKAQDLQHKEEVLHNIQKLDSTLKDSREVKEYVKTSVRELVHLSDQGIAPVPEEQEAETSPKKQFAFFDNKYKNRRSHKDIKLEPLEHHRERWLKIKKIQFGSNLDGRAQFHLQNFREEVQKEAMVSKRGEVRDDQSKVSFFQRSMGHNKQKPKDWNFMTSPRSPKSTNMAWRKQKHYFPERAQSVVVRSKPLPDPLFVQMQKKYEEKQRQLDLEKAEEYERFIHQRHRHLTSMQDIAEHRNKYEEDKASLKQKKEQIALSLERHRIQQQLEKRRSQLDRRYSLDQSVRLSLPKKYTDRILEEQRKKKEEADQIFKQGKAYIERVNRQARTIAAATRSLSPPKPLPKIRKQVPDEQFYKHDPVTCKKRHGLPPLPKEAKIARPAKRSPEPVSVAGGTPDSSKFLRLDYKSRLNWPDKLKEYSIFDEDQQRKLSVESRKPSSRLRRSVPCVSKKYIDYTPELKKHDGSNAKRGQRQSQNPNQKAEAASFRSLEEAKQVMSLLTKETDKVEKMKKTGETLMATTPGTTGKFGIKSSMMDNHAAELNSRQSHHSRHGSQGSHHLAPLQQQKPQLASINEEALAYREKQMSEFIENIGGGEGKNNILFINQTNSSIVEPQRLMTSGEDSQALHAHGALGSSRLEVAHYTPHDNLIGYQPPQAPVQQTQMGMPGQYDQMVEAIASNLEELDEL